MKTLLAVAVLAVAIPLAAQAPSKYVPNELQAATLKVKQLEFQLANVQYQQALQAANVAFTAVTEEAAKVKKENGWPDTVTYTQDPQSGAWAFKDAPKIPTGLAK